MTQPVVREAGLLERYHVSRHELGIFACVAIAAQYVGPNGVTLTKELLFAALARLIPQHAALGVRLSNMSAGKPTYVRLDAIDLSAIVTFSDKEKDELAGVLETQIATRFDTDAPLPLWRLAVLKDGTVVFAWHHAIGDGQSGLAFHTALLSALNENSERSFDFETQMSIQVPKDTMIVTPVESLVDLSVSMMTVLRELYNLLAPVSWTPSSTAWTGRTVPSTDSFAAPIRILQYSARDVEGILKLCRAHQSTLTAFLHTLSVLIISELLAADPASAPVYEFKCLSTCIPVSLRPLTKTPANAMCDEVSAYHSYPPLITLAQGHISWLGGFPWGTAAALTNEMRTKQLETKEQIGMLKFLFGNYDGYLKGMLGKKRQMTLELSNLGRFSLAPDGHTGSGGKPSWSIRDAIFTQSHPASGAALAVNVTGTPPGGIGLAVSWSREAVDDLFGEAFFSKLKEAMDEMASVSTS
ncbi:uncharacterized protein LAESUDRAFT_811952 [Laetiporus sulphureus 93-53]|uniref:Alcohol acetyltransferase n=1 Tax=Laetiporus sulphureus 93-53 TaxID=1314785 RepID=A0A165ET58_9APHY|nr:uncharacterized protein LAESUDRAFT_811952 [Laetiporus sulphureus 93-53]KZT07704.1 hypothetical protein LAESUDRAFT_811952 [Laetiporus sulphureus 93-53]